MNIIINASDLKAGGGLQVADSICCELDKYPQHHFVVVLSTYLQKTAERIADYENVETIFYNYNKYNIWLLLTGRDSFMDRLVKEQNVQAVMSIFGPNLWVPRCPHISGFARAHLLIPESDYYIRMTGWERTKERFLNKVLEYYFKRSSRYFYTENPFITERLKKLFPGIEVRTITNSYNQVFEHPENWKEKLLPKYDGASFLCITAPYPHKNLPIAIEVAKIWLKTKPDFKFRFIFTINPEDFPPLPPDLAEHFQLIGKVDIAECPSLYNQCTAAFQPTLIECFTATYPEAMIMRKPIVTTDLEFARGLCGDAACYYEATDSNAAAIALYKVSTDNEYAQKLINNGVKQLNNYDGYKQRTKKLLEYLDDIVIN